ncbi:MAG: hypothetical protein AAF654_09690 [Myxococcota bacterium]
MGMRGFLGLLCWCAACGSEPEVEVVGPDGRGIASASVIVLSKEGRCPGQALITDAEGRTEVPDFIRQQVNPSFEDGLNSDLLVVADGRTIARGPLRDANRFELTACDDPWSAECGFPTAVTLPEYCAGEDFEPFELERGRASYRLSSAFVERQQRTCCTARATTAEPLLCDGDSFDIFNQPASGTGPLQCVIRWFGDGPIDTPGRVQGRCAIRAIETYNVCLADNPVCEDYEWVEFCGEGLVESWNACGGLDAFEPVLTACEAFDLFLNP